jgi:uncharacterized protein YmfQ (DUF2313 family)
MAVMLKALLNSLPKGHPWRAKGNFGNLVEGLSLSLDRIRIFLRGVITESNPSTAVDTLEDWFSRLGIAYDATQTLTARQKRVNQEFASVGGVNKIYVESILNISYPDVSIEAAVIPTWLMAGVAQAGKAMAYDYPSWVPVEGQDGRYPVFYYRVTGVVQTPYDLKGVRNILDRIAIAEQEPVFQITVLGITDTAQAGLGVAGLAEAGKE